MDVHRNEKTGELQFKLDDHELTLPNWTDFIGEIKATIPAQNRSYNPETKEWFIFGKGWWGEFQDIRDAHFSDPNQISMF